MILNIKLNQIKYYMKIICGLTKSNEQQLSSENRVNKLMF